MATGAAIGGGLAASAIGAGMQGKSASEQAAAAQEGLSQQLYQQNKNFRNAENATSLQQDQLREQQNRGLEELSRGYEQQREAIQAGGQAQLDELGRANQAQLGFMGRGTEEAQRLLGQGAQQAQGTLGQALGLQGRADQANRLSSLLADPSKALQSPGFQFAQEQGEQAINRSAAARGGRLGGRTLKDLSRFNQGLASQTLGQQAQLAAQADAQDMAAAGQGFNAASQLAGMQNAAAGGQSALANALGMNAAGAAQQLGQGRIGLLGQTTQNLGNAYAQQGAGMNQAIGTNQSQLAQLALQPFNLVAAPGTGMNFQGPAQFAGGGSAAFGNFMGNMGNSAMQLSLAKAMGAF